MSSRQSEPTSVRAVCGGLSSMTAELFTMPVDTLKIRMQLQGRGQTNSIVRVVSAMVREEGVGAFWKGLSAGMARQAVYSTARMALYEPIRNVLGTSNDTLWNKIVAGGTGGALVMNHPDVCRLHARIADRD